MKLVRIELQKIWTQKLFLLALTGLLCCNLFFVWNDTRTASGNPPPAAFHALEEDLQGKSVQQQLEYTREQTLLLSGINRLIREISVNASNPIFESLWEQYGEAYQVGEYLTYCDAPMQEYRLFASVQRELEIIAQYGDFLANIQDKAQRLSSIGIFQSHGYNQENIDKTARDYAQMQNVKIEYSTSQGFITAIDFKMTDLILLAVLLLLASLTVRTEKDSGLLQFVRTVPAGRGRTAVAKFAAMAISLLAVMLLLYGVNFAYCAEALGLGSLHRSVQSIPDLIFCPLPLRVWQYMLLFFGVKWMTAAAVGAAVLAITLLCRKALTAYFFSAACMGAQFALYLLSPANGAGALAKYANAAALLDTNDLLAAYTNINLFGHPVSKWVVETVFGVLLLALSFTAFYLAFAKAHFSAPARRASLSLFKPRRAGRGLAAHEGYKLLVLNGAGAIMLLLFAFQCYEGLSTEYYLNRDTQLYNAYLSVLAGPYNREKYEWLNNKYQTITSGLHTKQRYAAGEISLEEFQELEMQREPLEQEKHIFQEVAGKLEYMKQYSGAQFINEKGYAELLGLNNNRDGTDTLLGMVAVVLCFSGLFAIEYTSGMEKILKSTLWGRKITAAIKLRLATAGALAISTALVLPKLILTLRYYGLSALWAPAYSLPAYASAPSWLPVVGLLLFFFAARFVAVWAMAMVTAAFSNAAKNTLFALFLSCAILGLPLLLYTVGLPGLQWLSTWPLFHLPMLFYEGGGMAFVGWCYLLLWGGIGWFCRYYLKEFFGTNTTLIKTLLE